MSKEKEEQIDDVFGEIDFGDSIDISIDEAGVENSNLDAPIREEDMIPFHKEEKPKVKRTRKPKEEKVILPDFDKMSKAELQEYVKARGIRVYYHDTIAVLKEKALQKI